MNGWCADLRHALSVYRGTPIATAVAVIALAAAMAFATAFLSMWNDLSLRPPEGFQNNGRLVTIGQDGGYDAVDSSTPLTLDIIEGIDETVSALQFAAGVASFPQLLYQDLDQTPIQAEAVTRRFSDLQPRLQLGRSFEERDHFSEAEPAVILSYRLWRDRFGERADVLGETIRISDVGFSAAANLPQGISLPELPGQDYRVVGVMSPRMTGTFVEADVWLPYEQAVPFLFGEPDSAPAFELQDPTQVIGLAANTDSSPTRMRGLAQLAAGASARAATDELNTRLNIEGQAVAFGLVLSGREIRFDVIDGIVRDIDVQRETERQVELFLAGTLLLVLVAACNISLFLIARASHRQRELGIRMAVGAPIRRLARQLASEAGLLIFAATVLGVLLSLWLSAALRELPFLQQAEWRNVSPFDWRVLGVLAGVILLLTLLVSLAPMLGLRRMGIGASSSRVTARAGLGQRLTGTVQIALTGIVGAIAIAFAWHLVFYATADRGFDAEDVLVVQLERTPATPQATTLEGVMLERDRKRDVIAGLPGVEDASFTTYTPGGAGELSYLAFNRDGNTIAVTVVYVDEHYFDVLGISLAYGSNVDFIEAGGAAFVANEAYAIATFGRADVAGEVTSTGRVLNGVIGDVAFGHPAEAVSPMSFAPRPVGFYPLVLVKTSMSPGQLRALLQQKIDSGELELGLGEILPLADIANRDLRPDRVRAVFTATSAVLVVILAAFGFFEMQRYLVTAGQREYAIRSALGAGPRSLGRLVILRGAGLGLPGLIFGIVLAFLVVAWLRDGFLVSAVSPAGVSLAVVLLIVALILTSNFGPAQQARRSSPATLLREN